MCLATALAMTLHYSINRKRFWSVTKHRALIVSALLWTCARNAYAATQKWRCSWTYPLLPGWKKTSAYTKLSSWENCNKKMIKHRGSLIPVWFHHPGIMKSYRGHDDHVLKKKLIVLLLALSSVTASFSKNSNDFPFVNKSNQYMRKWPIIQIRSHVL